MSALDDLKSRFLKFRTKKYAIYVGLALTFLACTLLLLYSPNLICFGPLLVGLAGYYIPVLFGMKSKKKLAVWGVVLVILLAVPYTFVIMDNTKSAQDVKLGTSDGSMTNGTVTPFQGSENTEHVFTVQVNNASLSDIRVIVYDVQTNTIIVNATMSNQTSNTPSLFYYNTTLNERAIYGYQFEANSSSGYVFTNSAYGPLHVDDTSLFAYWFPLIIFALLFQVGVLYYLLLLMNFWVDRTKARQADLQKQRPNVDLPPPKGGKEEKFICSECGAEVPSSANRCPQCGERFDEAKEEPKRPKKDEFVCTECGAAVDEKARTCWNCGKEFEN